MRFSNILVAPTCISKFVRLKRLKKFYSQDVIECGCDEAGRGCLAGPVVAAAVILAKNKYIRGLNDSKKLNPEQRNLLRKEIEKKALAWKVEFVQPKEIDQINILQASITAMKRAVNKLEVEPHLILVDGKYFVPHEKYEHVCIIKGDSKYQSIAAASILAKTYRDEYMERAHLDFPNYSWNQNKGYPTHVHRKAIIDYGTTWLHRKSFRLYPLPEQLSLFS